MLILAMIAVLQVGCGSSVPGTPEGTVEAVAKGISEKQPDIVWEAMPASYQEDVNGLIHQFAEAMDESVHEKLFEVTSKLENVLSSKKEFIVNSKMLSQGPIDKAEFEKNYDSLVDLIAAVNNSDVADLGALKNADAGDMLASTGRDVMEALAALSAASKDDPMGDMLDELKGIKVEVLSSDENAAKVKTTVGDKVEEIDLVKVDERWVPKEMAEGWDDGIAMAKKNLEEMAKAMKENKMQQIGMLGGIEATLDELLKVESQEEFDQFLEGMGGNLPMGRLPFGSGLPF
jgi:hypothetical protein